MKLLCICDSPTMQSGFARVAYNLITRWHAADIFEDIWVWGIGYTGFPHRIKFLQNRICPAATYTYPEWYHVHNYQRLLNLLEKDEIGDSKGGFTHVWILQDTFLLYPVAKAFKELCRDRGIATLLYFPVDAPLEPEWANIIDAVDHPVAYCEYGAREARKALLVETDDKSLNKSRARTAERIKIIPHGVDTTVYKKLEDVREQARKAMFRGRVAPNDFLILNVSAHQKRKGLAQTLAILARLKEICPEMNPKLMMHMPHENVNERTDLRQMAIQFGLVNAEDVFYGNESFDQGHPILPEANLNGIYNTCDLLLSTSYGEGWGLPITEAMAAGLACAGPRHTSIQEILGDERGILFDTNGSDVLAFDNSRVRPRTDVGDAALRIVAAWENEQAQLKEIAARGHEWARSAFLGWDRIAELWAKLFVE